MKRTMKLTAAAAVLLVAASCQKAEETRTGTKLNPVFTARIESSVSKTTVNTSSGVVSWGESDEITVKDNSGATAKYVITEIDGTTGKATFEIKSGETELGEGPYSAVYGSAPTTAQTYSSVVGGLYMTAPATETTEFTFTVQVGLMEIALTKSGESVQRISVTGTPEGGSQTTYTLSCSSAVSIASEQKFFIALPAGVYKKLEIVNASGAKCIHSGEKGVTVSRNGIIPISYDASGLVFVSGLPKGALSGEFTVGKGADNELGTEDDIKVHFSQGNLIYTRSTGKFDFESTQYDIRKERNSESDVIGEFHFSSDVSIATSDIRTAYSSPLFTNSDATSPNPDFEVSGVKGVYRTLSLEEWNFMMNSRTKATSLTAYPVTVCGEEKCRVYAPDGCADFSTSKTSYSEEEWAIAQAAGYVCIHAWYYQKGTTRNYNQPIFLASTGGDVKTYSLATNSGDSGFLVNNLFACSIRLVTDVE